ncbi:hypothetical protein B7463_g155, partial [Scytalidium lignicola]
MASTDDLEYLKWEALVGHIIAKRVSPGYVVLSYVISYIGALTTLELINRRTATRGLFNWFILICSAISMGGISVWCMHFIGNRALILGDGAAFGQIAYNPGYTGLSFFVPIIVLTLAFWAVGTDERVHILRVVLGGAIVGFSVCGMHYLGQAGIINYVCIYSIGHIVGAAAIAVVASIGALGIFFRWRSSWAASFWRRALCAVILSGAVSGMHWIASVGTQYRLKPSNHVPDSMSRNSTVIVVIILSVGSCFIFLALTLVAQHRRRLAADRAQKVSLAAAYFDPDGRLMVSPEGLLPSRKITDAFIERSFDDVFNVSHPVFLWIYRTSYYWPGVTKLLPGMLAHIPQLRQKDSAHARKSGINLVTDQGVPVDDYSIIFRELFCIAAANLAEQVNKSLEEVGVLFPAIINTGRKPGKKGSRQTTPASSADIEHQGVSAPILGSGQLLFLVNKLSRHDCNQLQASGWRFAVPRNVAPILARSMQVDVGDLRRYLGNMSDLAKTSPILEPGVHLACFSIRAAVSGRFDVLVCRNGINQLPTMQLPFNNLEGWFLDYLKTMDGKNVIQCTKHLQNTIQSTSHPKEQLLATQFLATLEALRNEIADTVFNDALLISKPFQAPCRGVTEISPPGTAILIAFRLMAPIHSSAHGKNLEFIPLNLFKALQHVYKNSPDHAVFARKTYREFSPILDAATRQARTPNVRLTTPRKIFSRQSTNTFGNGNDDGKVYQTTSAPKSPARIHRWKKRSQSSRYDDHHVLVKPDNSSENNLVHTISQEQHPFGGILVSQDVNVDVRDFPDSVDGVSGGGGSGSSTLMPMNISSWNNNKYNGYNGQMRPPGKASIEMVDMHFGRAEFFSTVTKEGDESVTFADELLAVCVENR